jgi:hypothetical protein
MARSVARTLAGQRLVASLKVATDAPRNVGKRENHGIRVGGSHVTRK